MNHKFLVRVSKCDPLEVPFHVFLISYPRAGPLSQFMHISNVQGCRLHVRFRVLCSSTNYGKGCAKSFFSPNTLVQFRLLIRRILLGEGKNGRQYIFLWQSWVFSNSTTLTDDRQQSVSQMYGALFSLSTNNFLPPDCTHVPEANFNHQKS